MRPHPKPASKTCIHAALPGKAHAEEPVTRGREEKAHLEMSGTAGEGVPGWLPPREGRYEMGAGGEGDQALGREGKGGREMK